MEPVSSSRRPRSFLVERARVMEMTQRQSLQAGPGSSPGRLLVIIDIGSKIEEGVKKGEVRPSPSRVTLRR